VGVASNQILRPLLPVLMVSVVASARIAPGRGQNFDAI